MLFLTANAGHNQVIESYNFVMGDDVETAQPYRMIGSPMYFPSVREAVEAAAFCGFTVFEDGHVLPTSN